MNKINSEETNQYRTTNNWVSIQDIQEHFQSHNNYDLLVRKVYIKSLKADGYIAYLNGTVDVKVVDESIVRPLQQENSLENVDDSDQLDFLAKRIIPVSNVGINSRLENALEKIVSGYTLLFVEDTPFYLEISTPGFESRGVEKSEDEAVLKGPKEAFSESMDINLSLVRKLIKSSELIAEYSKVGEMAVNEVGILYMTNIVNPDLLDKVRNRINEIDTDEVLNLALLEQHIEERPYSLIPTVLYTERPDRAAAFLKEGHVILIMNNSPSCLIVPVTFWGLFHTPEDAYSRWFYGNFIRIIRLIAIFVTILTPSLYIATTNYHIEMLPTDLVLAISATRERVPFPAIFEVVMLLGAFELIRESGVRVPSPIGPTIGIVGALILGQAAVEANLISPILVIVVAVTGLASFAIPNLSFSYMIRLSTYLFLIFASFWGFYGIAACIVMSIGYLTSVTSYDVPFLSPLAPFYPSSKDLIVRPPIWKQWLRPFNVHPQNKQRKKKPEGVQNQ
ncbi:spore germination protein [Bacillus sp. 31A1R]|uniref:Spore germination protein n=1 Tax=Robertmurraya mangrovi TaxID=3098077 RepID=A0ABU5IWR8_9BACI|nr:spore germination protein [Bacillus sp. 31A1R]MDZ5471582.1 spore germination protein [Bacillus sp. 31A1R]